MTTTKEPTRKQRLVLGMLAENKTPKQIAKSMGITKTTVYAHLRNLRQRGLVDDDGFPTQGVKAEPALADDSSNGSEPAGNGTLAKVGSIVQNVINEIDGRTEEIVVRSKSIDDEVARLSVERELLDGEAAALTEKRQALVKV